MTKSRTNPRVDFRFSEAKKWRAEMNMLRKLVLDTGLTEELKWGEPCYTFENGNVVIIHGFKEYCALLFFKGVLLRDPKGILIQQTKNTQAARQIRFTDVRDIAASAPVLKAYLRDALDVERSGRTVTYKKTSAFKVPEEFQERLDSSPALKTAFRALTPGRQRAYLLHFSAPKQSKTRAARVEKYVRQILGGKGLRG